MPFEEILPRLIWSAILVSAGLVAWQLANRWILRRAGRILPGEHVAGIPAILYFTTPTCAPCKTFQRPAIEKVKQILGNCLKVIEIDATAQPEVASQWGVLSVPTIFVLDQDGKPRHVNHGPTGVEKLLQQLNQL